jgi:hypothetical protein
MSDMKLILENWRQYVAEQDAPQDLGPMYIFENETVTTVSFGDRLDMLTESEGDLLLFIEQWERSVDYTLETLEEGLMGQLKLFGKDPIGFLSTQAFHLLEKLKKTPKLIIKGIKKVFSAGGKVVKLSERARKKHPKLWKLGITVGMTIIAAAVAILLVAIPEAFAGDLMTNSGELIANAEELSKHADFLDNTVADMVDQIKEVHATGDSEGTRELIDAANDLKERAETLRQIAENPDDQSMIELGVSAGREAEETVKELRGIQDAAAQAAEEAAGSAAGDAGGIPGVNIDTSAGEIQVEVDFKGNLQMSKDQAMARAREALEKAGQSSDIQPTGGGLDKATGKFQMAFKFTPK